MLPLRDQGYSRMGSFLSTLIFVFVPKGRPIEHSKPEENAIKFSKSQRYILSQGSFDWSIAEVTL